MRTWLAAIFGLALVLRLLAIFVLPGEDRYPDSDQFLSIAEHLVEGKGFLCHDKYEHGRQPLYSIYLAGVFAAGGTTRAAQAGQALMDAACALLAGLLALRLGGSQRAALGAAALWAVNPYGIYFSRLLLSECLAGVLFVGALAVWAGLPGRPSLASAAGAGLLFGLCALTRPSALGTGLIAAVILGLDGAAPRASRVRAAVVVIAVLALVQVPWSVRNSRLYGEFMIMSPLGGMTLFDSFNDHTDGGVRTTKDLPWPTGQNLAEIDRKQGQLAREWALAHPKEVAWLAVEKQKRFWSPIPNFEKYRRMPYVLVGVFEVPFLLAGLAGCVMAVLRRREAMRLVPLVAYFPLVHTIFLGSLRYRMPVEPLLAVTAGLLVDELSRRA